MTEKEAAKMPNHEPPESVTVEQGQGWEADAAIFRLKPLYFDERTIAAGRIDFQTERVDGTKTSVRLTVKTARTLSALLLAFIDDVRR